MKLKRNFLLIFFLLAGVLLGAMLSQLCNKVDFLSWLSYSCAIGFSPQAPMVIDLAVIKLTFGFSMEISVMQIFTIIASIFIYNKTNLK